MPPRSRSVVSENSLGHSDDEDGVGPSNGRAGKGKDGSKDVDQRKEQNRVAQREFRQRKQQYIKGLEARLALHESSRDDQLDQLRTGMTALIDENQRLRELLAQVAGFIGEGVGGTLAKIGVDMPEFQSLINRNRTEHILNTLDTLREQGSTPGASSSAPAGLPPPPKRQRTAPASVSSPSHSPVASTSAATSTPSSIPAPAIPANPYAYNVQSSVPQAPPYGGFTLPPELSTGRPSPTSGPPASVMQAARECANLEHSNHLDAVMTLHANKAMNDFTSGTSTAEEHEDEIQKMFSLPSDNPKLQAIQLISYHMRNLRTNPGYHLPPSLRATVTQQSVPHSPFFDGIIFASLRDRLILLKDQYDLPTLLSDLIESVSIHEDDILQPSNWELNETFIRKYWYVIDADVLSISNRWRRERGEPELSLREIVPDGSDIRAEGLLGKKSV